MRKAPKVLIIVACSFVLFSFATALSPAMPAVDFWRDEPIVEFSDMQNFRWAEHSVYKLVEWGIMSGDKHDYQVNFRPSAYMRRAEFAKVLINAFGAYKENAREIRYDNTPEKWHFTYVSSMIEAGIARGYSPEWFGSEDNILRQDIAVIIKNAMDYAEFDIPVMSNPPAPFADSENISADSQEAVEYLASRGIFRGDRHGNFMPHQFAERVEIAVVIERILSAGRPL
jgi:chitinase